MKVFVVEDSPEVRERLCALIAQVPGLQLAGTADSADAALREIAATQPDVVTLDLHLADGSGMAVLRQIKATLPGIKVIVLTAMDYRQYRQRCEAYGAEHYLVKSRDTAALPALLAEMNKNEKGDS